LCYIEAELKFKHEDKGSYNFRKWRGKSGIQRVHPRIGPGDEVLELVGIEVLVARVDRRELAAINGQQSPAEEFQLPAQQGELPRHGLGGDFAGGFDLFKARAHMALAGEVIDFVRGDFGQDAVGRGGVIQIGVMQKKPAVIDGGIIQQVADAGVFRSICRPRYAMNLITFFKQLFGEIRTVLPGDTRDERAGHG
jgi:hypothetical protein